MNLPSRSIIASAALATGLLAPAARAAEPTETDQLRQQVAALQATVDGLQRKLEQRVALASVSPPDASAAADRPGQPAVVLVSQEDLNGVRSDLEQFKYQYNRDREYSTAVSNRPLNFSGTIQARYGYANDVVAPVPGTAASLASNGVKSQFTDGNVSLRFTGNLYRDYEEGKNLTYLLRAAASTTATGTTSNIALQFASLTYNFLQTLSPEDPRLTLTAGQQLLPFGLDVAAPDELKPTINTAQFAALFPNAIDLGLLLRGELGVQYDYGYGYRAPILVGYLGVLNGSGANTGDNNNSKDVFGRLVFTVPAEYNSWLRQLAFGVSGYKGRVNTSIVSGGAAVLSGTARRDRLGFDVYYNHHPFGLTYEFVEGWDGRTYGTALAAKDLQTVRSRGQVLTMYYTFGEQFLYGQSALGTTSIASGRFDDWWPKSYQPFLRADWFDPSKGQHDAAHGFRKTTYTAGFNVFFAQTTKFQLNANLVKDTNPASQTRDVRQVLAQFQFGF